MFSFSNVFHFFAHELARLRGRGFAFTLVFARPFHCVFFWHTKDCFAASGGFGRHQNYGRLLDEPVSEP
jgi:hypothetical protein